MPAKSIDWQAALSVIGSMTLELRMAEANVVQLTGRVQSLEAHLAQAQDEINTLHRKFATDANGKSDTEAA